jgi:hypothetical protein
MDRIYERHDDVGTCGCYVYAAWSEDPDGYFLYEDKNYTVPMTTGKMKDCFVKGCVVVYNYGENHEHIAYIKPNGFVENPLDGTGIVRCDYVALAINRVESTGELIALDVEETLIACTVPDADFIAE